MSELDDRLRGEDASTVLHWFDYVCPFCYVGQHRTAILARAGLHVVELPFQIHPEIPSGGISMGARSGPMYAMLEREAKAAGLPLRWPVRLPNTRHALAVTEWVRRHDAHAFPILHGQLFEAHFVLGEDIGDPAVVDGHAKACGADVVALHAALAEGSAEAAVVEAETVGRKHGVHGTPAWLLPQGLITGLRPAAEFEHLVERSTTLRH